MLVKFTNMNILFLTTHLNTGGITSYLFNLTNGLIRRGVNVHVVSSGGNMEKDFLALGAKVVNLNMRTKSELDGRIYAALKPLKQYVEQNNIDVIHAQTRITQVMGRLLQKICRKPYVATCHGFFKTRLSRRLFPCWGDKTIAISQAVVDHLKDDFAVPLQKIILVESGIDVEAFNPVDEEAKMERRKVYGLGCEPLVGIVARLSDVKGQDVLIQAMPHVVAAVPNIKLLIVGEGKMESLLKDMVAQLNLQTHVIFLPVVNKAAEVLSLLDVFVMPSRQEGLGLSVIEAQAAGLPVVASRVGGIPSLIEDGKTGVLVEPENSKALAKGMIELLANKEHAEKIGLAGRDFVKKFYSLEGMMDKMLEIYRGLK